MIGRIVWLTALAATALLTVLLQFDWHARSNAAMAEVVPVPLRNYAQARVTQGAVNGADPSAALAEAERLVRRRPLPAENLSLLAVAQAKAGRLDEAARTIQVAGQRGWREPMAQEAVLRLALSAGDTAEAARRYAALLLLERTPDALLEELGPAVLGEPDGMGQRTLVAVVTGGERWHPLFLRRGARVIPPAAFSAIAAESLAQGAAFDCGVLEQSVRALTGRDAAAGARLRAAAQGRCPGLARE